MADPIKPPEPPKGPTPEPPKPPVSHTQQPGNPPSPGSPTERSDGRGGSPLPAADKQGVINTPAVPPAPAATATATPPAPPKKKLPSPSELKEKMKEGQIWKSIFRHKLDDTPRNRSLAVLSNVFLHLHPAKINRDAVRYNFTWGMGGITFYLFCVLTITGVLLMYYFHPSKGQAFRDIMYLQHDVPFGNFMRNMHRWAAHAMVITVWLHMFRVFLTGSYKPPREFNWNIGVLLLLFTLLLSFTGYLLPDDQLGFWAVTVGTNMARATPLIGHEGPWGPQLGFTAFNDVRFALLGGSIVDANALLRAYIWHCIAIPIIASVLMIVHFWRIRKDGAISGPAPVMIEQDLMGPVKTR